MADKLALVTGAAGFLGASVAAQLARDGWAVHGLGHPSPVGRPSRSLARWCEADVDAGALAAWGERPDLVVHCAGSGSVRATEQNPDAELRDTVGTVAAIVEYLSDHAPSCRLVLASSAAVYGEAGEAPLSEDHPIAPVSRYGMHKVLAEETCRRAASLHALRWSAVRLFSVYGPGLRKQLLWDASVKFTRGECEFDGDGREVRDFLHVDDAARLLVMAERWATVEGHVVNGGSGEGVAVTDVLRRLADCLGLHAVPRFTGRRRPGDPRSLVANCTRARQGHWRPEIPWQPGVETYAAWFKAESRSAEGNRCTGTVCG